MYELFDEENYSVVSDPYYTELAREALGLDEPEDFEPTERDYDYLDA